MCPDYLNIKDADIVGAYNISLSQGYEIKPNSKKGIIEKGKLKKQKLLEENLITL